MNSIRLSALESALLIVKYCIHGTYLITICLSKIRCVGLSGRGFPLAYHRLAGMWTASSDVTRLRNICVESPVDETFFGSGSIRCRSLRGRELKRSATQL